MKIYSTRHGQTDYNKQGIIMGSTDLPLNDTGCQQAEKLLRAQMTANAVSLRCGLEVVTDERLREWNYGAYEGKPRTAGGFAAGKHEFGVRMGGTGESLLQLSHRVYSALDDIIARYSGKNVLIVSHGGVCRVIETYFHDMTIEEFDHWFMGNCKIIEYNV